MNILITGANGFVGRALCIQLSTDNKIIGVDITKEPDKSANITWEQADPPASRCEALRAGLTDGNSVAAICEKHSPDVVIHCAGIAHQKIGTVDAATYMRVNSEATENLAKAAGECNPDVQFIFLSSVSVYGEHPQITQITQNKKDTSCKGAKALKKKNNSGVGEDGDCRPSSDYAVSKVDAERRLVALSDEGIIRNLIILRLAPVYDREWSLNLDRRVFAPGKLAYLRFGSGSQRMSALARPNLVEFIAHLIGENWPQTHTDAHRRTGRKKDENNLCNQRNLRINVCDAEPYEFNRIIRVFKKSGIRPNRPVISVPLSVVWFATRIAGVFFSNKKEWIHSCYDKLAYDLVFDNGRMMGTGFRARHSLETIFNPQIPQITRIKKR